MRSMCDARLARIAAPARARLTDEPAVGPPAVEGSTVDSTQGPLVSAVRAADYEPGRATADVIAAVAMPDALAA